MAAGVLSNAWLSGHIGQLMVTDAELEGTPRLQPGRLLRRVGFWPFLGGLEPYTTMTTRLNEVVRSPQALFDFAYDWRLSIEYNARLLATHCDKILTAWRTEVKQKRYGDPDEVRITIVGHSMGGLVARYAAEVCGAAPMIRKVITLGTPHFGSVKTVQMLARGKGSPLPHRAARELARTCPGVYDLLPHYRCVTPAVDQRDQPAADRHLSEADVIEIGGDGALTHDAAERYARLASATSGGGAVPILPLAGAHQPTLQRITIHHGEARFYRDLGGTDYEGDTTVYRGAAAPQGVTAFPLPQKHGALAKTAEAITFVTDKLVGADTGPPLGTRPLGADIPELGLAGTTLTVRVAGTDDLIGVAITSVDINSGARTAWLPGVRRENELLFTGPALKPGLHRIEVKTGGFSPITDVILMAETPGSTPPGINT
jgi:pimeloyl-ACP methyl ester carboxylesterase